ncbi:MAG: hydantoinase/oxoprolinase family protein [Alphaproteobacteria bacterium]|nr:hydantoinase/oxoprolinase family protein [Alphaproteobacteria bacterium]
MSGEARFRLGVDVGGTHTDLVLLDVETGNFSVEKVSSTPHNPAIGVLNGVNNFVAKGTPPDEIGFFSHGTTITTNALLEMRGAKVGLMITDGYRAVQEIQSQGRDGNPFDYFYDKPVHLAPQSMTREIPGRIDWEGTEVTALNEDVVREHARSLMESGATSIAICYLFSYANSAHEERSREIILEEFPDAHVSLSSEVLPRIREWPRLSTTLLNAYLGPVLVDYIGHLNKGLDDGGVTTQQRFLMQSNGGVMPFTAAVQGGKTVYTLFSGPAAGAQAGAYLSGDDAMTGIVTLDMGGTSADIAFIEGGEPLEVTEVVVARRPMGVPALDLTTISAGGGSIAWIDRGGFLCVGPQSAGADPGPACYGKGGEDPAVTDADIALGYLNPGYFLGGSQTLDKEASEKALEEKIAKPLGMTIREAAAGIRRIVDLRMADEVKVFAAKRGVDPQDFCLLPFGGAGAVHAASVAEELGITRIFVPPRPGAFSALGLLCTDIVHDYVRSELRPMELVPPEHAEEVFQELEARGVAELKEEGIAPDGARFERELDVRYTGQGYELRVSLDGLGGSNGLSGEDMDAARNRFDDHHAKIHGHAAKDRSVEIVSYRVRLRVSVPKYEPVPVSDVIESAAPADAVKGTRTVYFTADEATETTLYERDKLPIGARIDGPAIVEQFDSTIVVPQSWVGRIDGFGNLILSRER